MKVGGEMENYVIVTKPKYNKSAEWRVMPLPYGVKTKKQVKEIFKSVIVIEKQIRAVSGITAWSEYKIIEQ